MNKMAVFYLVWQLFFCCHALASDHHQEGWLSHDYEGYMAYEKGHYQRAMNLFHAPLWKGLSAYRLGDYKAATHWFAQDKSARGWYNLGNAYAMRQQWHQAAQAYQQALTKNPHWHQASDNLDWVEKQRQRKKKNQSQARDKTASGIKNPHSAAKKQASSSTHGKKTSSKHRAEKKQTMSHQSASKKGGKNTAHHGKKRVKKGDASGRSQAKSNHVQTKSTARATGKKHAPSDNQVKAQGRKKSNDHASNSSGLDHSVQHGHKQNKSQAPLMSDKKQGQRLVDQARKKQYLAKQKAQGKKNTQPINRAITKKSKKLDENNMQVHHWLRRVPDDPGGLLKRKLLRDYWQRKTGERP